jgi:rod shape-determining protein MreC
MKQYINPSYSRVNHSFKNGFVLVFKKIETVLFSFLCVVFLITGKISDDFQKDVSFAFVNISLPVIKAASFPFNVVINLVTGFSELVEAKKENEVLKAELEKLKIYYVQSLDISEENKELRDALNFVTAKSSTFKVASIIGKSSQVFNQKVFIDIGENRGISEGQIVTTRQGVIGRIDEVSKNRSRLILINDATSRVPIIASKARVRGILAGNGSGLMEILYLPKNHKIEVGDSIFTSGDGDTLPAGLFIGVVKKVDEDSAFVAMAQDLAAANVVTIVGY